MSEEKNLIENGLYEAMIVGEGRVYENANKTLVCCFTVDISGIERKSFLALTKRDGSVNEFQVKRVKEMFPEWDGDPAWLGINENTGGVMVVAEIVNENGWSNIKELRSQESVENEGSKIPESMDNKALSTKYGSKFRALLGGTKVAPPAQEQSNADPLISAPHALVLPVKEPPTQEPALGLETTEPPKAKPKSKPKSKVKPKASSGPF